MHILDLTTGKEATELNGQYVPKVFLSSNSRYVAFTMVRNQVDRFALWALEKGDYV